MNARWVLAVALTASVPGWVRGQSAASNTPQSQAKQAIYSAPPKPAEALYLELHGVGLDPARTYHIRGASLDRPALHVSLEDGEISFTSDVAGRVTGAIFEGDGELLLTPPNQVERASMALFTGMAILEERFASAYLRFNDETFAELQPYLRPADDAQEFSARWDSTARELAEQDALRLLETFNRGLPVSRAPNATADSSRASIPRDRLLHIRAQGRQLGSFDVYFDTEDLEAVWAGQTRTVDGVTYYDLWTSFTPGGAGTGVSGRKSPTRNDDIVIPRYRIRAEVDPPTTLSAQAILQVEVRRGGERTLYFELSRFLQVKEVDVDGRPVEFINNTALDGTQLARRGNDLVAVVFPEALREGQRLELKFVYKGDVLSEAGGGLLYVGARGTWYPNRGMLMSDFDLDFHYPMGWTLVATGKRVAQGAESAASDGVSPAIDTGKQVGHWITERPIVLAGFNLGKYDRASASAGVVTVEAFAARSMEKSFPRTATTIISRPAPLPPRPGTSPIARESVVPSPARNAQAVADLGARAVDFLSQRFGVYPYSSLELTQMPGRVSQGWPGLVFLSSYAFLTPSETEDLSSDPLQGAFNSLILPHETAHQWWGDLVGWGTYRDQWIVEALANYSALMMMEADKPNDARKILERYRSNLLEKNKNGESLRDAGPVTLGQRLNSSHFPNGYDAVSYGRGTWLFHMLRHMLLDAEAKQPGGGSNAPSGTDEPFVRALRKVRDRYAGKAISTKELFAVFEEDLPKSLRYEGHKSLDWFVQGWVEGVALPRLSTQNVKFVMKAGGTEVTGTIRQKEAPRDLVSAVPVFAVSVNKPVLLGIVMADGPETPFRFVVPPGTKKIVLDAYQTILTSPK
jgi:peptidase M1-like protein